jgi:hypothetical protein
MITFLVAVPTLVMILLFIGGAGNSKDDKGLDARTCSIMGFFGMLMLGAALVLINQRTGL